MTGVVVVRGRASSGSAPASSRAGADTRRLVVCRGHAQCGVGCLGGEVAALLWLPPWRRAMLAHLLQATAGGATSEGAPADGHSGGGEGLGRQLRGELQGRDGCQAAGGGLHMGGSGAGAVSACSVGTGFFQRGNWILIVGRTPWLRTRPNLQQAAAGGGCASLGCGLGRGHKGGALQGGGKNELARILLHARRPLGRQPRLTSSAKEGGPLALPQ